MQRDLIIVVVDIEMAKRKKPRLGGCKPRTKRSSVCPHIEKIIIFIFELQIGLLAEPTNTSEIIELAIRRALH